MHKSVCGLTPTRAPHLFFSRSSCLRCPLFRCLRCWFAASSSPSLEDIGGKRRLLLPSFLRVAGRPCVCACQRVRHQQEKPRQAEHICPQATIVRLYVVAGQHTLYLLQPRSDTTQRRAVEH